MVTFHKLGELGRLGNQLFQYAALKGLASKNGYTAKIPNPQTMSWHGQVSLLDKFNIECEYATQEDMNTLQNLYEEPTWEKYDDNFFNIPDNTSLEGFFQSTFYFEHIDRELKNELTPKKEYLDKATKFIDYLKGQHNCEIVSVHVRRGDNMTNGQTGLIQAFEPGGMYETYFNEAKKVFEGKIVICIACDEAQYIPELCYIDYSVFIDYCALYDVSTKVLAVARLLSSISDAFPIHIVTSKRNGVDDIAVDLS